MCPVHGGLRMLCNSPETQMQWKSERVSDQWTFRLNLISNLVYHDHMSRETLWDPGIKAQINFDETQSGSLVVKIVK